MQTFGALVVPGLRRADHRRHPHRKRAGLAAGARPLPGRCRAALVDAETVAVAQWNGTYLPDGSRVAADATFDRVLPNFGPVTTVTQPAGFES